MRVLLVVNPAASSVTTRARASLEAHPARRVTSSTVVRDDAARPRHRARPRRRRPTAYDVVFVLAGDGTLNEAGRRPRRHRRPRSRALPGGSTNVFARTLGIAYDAGRRRPAGCVGALGRGPGPARRPRLGDARPATPARRFLFHLGAGLRRRDHPPDGAALVPEASLRPPRVRARRVRHVAAPLRPRRAIRLRVGDDGRRRVGRRVPTPWCRTRTRTPTSATGA